MRRKTVEPHFLEVLLMFGAVLAFSILSAAGVFFLLPSDTEWNCRLFLTDV